VKLYDKNLVHKATLENIVRSEISEGINAEYTLTVTTIIEDATKAYLNHNHIVEADDNYFNIAAYRIYRSGAAQLIDLECEQVSYDLNDPAYDKEYFTEDGTPTYILGKILQGTGFSVGTVEFTKVATYSIQQKMSRRSILLEFASYIGAEIKFDKYTVSLLTRRGADTGIEFKIGKNIKGIEKYIDARNMVDGQPTVAYDLNVVELRSLPEFGALEAFALGDTVRILDSELGIDANVRIVRYHFDPVKRINSSLEALNFFSTLSDTIYRIQRDTVQKDELYYGARIGPENGFESIRSDNMARGVFNADLFALQAGDGSGGNWENKVYFDPVEGKYIFDGLLSASAIEAVSAAIDVVISNTVIVNNLYAEKGNISELTVDQLDTSTMVQKYLNGDKSDLHYIKIYEQNIEFIEAQTSGQSAQLLNRSGQPLYWVDENHAGSTTNETDWPIMVYVYTEYVKLKHYFELDSQSGYMIPKMVWGTGFGDGDKGKAFIFKDNDGLVFQYVNSAGITREIRLGEAGVSGTGEDLSSIALYADGMITSYGDGAVYDWDWIKDGSGQITSITNNTTNNTTTITWNAGNKP
jgi:hypothetical protein